jgi:hypothetical protein
MSTHTRDVPLYVLICYKKILKQLDSFTEELCAANFTVKAGWSGIMSVDSHNIGERKIELRADEALKLRHVSLEDKVTLTEDQYNDFKRISILMEPEPRHRRGA